MRGWRISDNDSQYRSVRGAVVIYSFLITLREGLEASLVVGIMLAYLARTGRRSGFGPVLWGAGSALIASLLGGWLLQALTGGLTGAAMEIFEGGMMLAAAALLTWMILWMQRQARSLRAEIQGRLDSTDGSYLALAGVAFTVVIREGALPGPTRWRPTGWAPWRAGWWRWC
jgi:high-affinity iron transporter